MYFEINEYFKEMIRIIKRYGGDVIKFAGDAMFVVWKSPKELEKVSFQRSILCAMEIIAQCSSWKVEARETLSSDVSSECFAKLNVH
eukprot:gene18074-23080_t